jgi:hypothetical protein
MQRRAARGAGGPAARVRSGRLHARAPAGSRLSECAAGDGGCPFPPTRALSSSRIEVLDRPALERQWKSLVTSRASCFAREQESDERRAGLLHVLKQGKPGSRSCFWRGASVSDRAAQAPRTEGSTAVAGREERPAARSSRFVRADWLLG